jgi:hypothetical protein
MCVLLPIILVSYYYHLTFNQDGVLEVATFDKGTDKLYKYLEWGYSIGSQKNQSRLLDKHEVHDFEPK